MNRRRITSLSLLLAVLIGGGLLLNGFLRSGERASIRERYDSLQAAMRAGDTNAIRLLFAPGHRARADEQLGRFQTFALPLDRRSGISLSGDRAQICPRREFPLLPVLNIGHTIEMIREDGEWYFTGKISIF